ncbi:MAG: hypothetical protein C7B45_01570 [Sulfobacillus acidophilus]|uniref:FAS1-like dehydratase domain-containing protein n=1 Tax=Sulfobacillus acidophilus TaxID=53633 RepID=A0A2T2WNC2_9FIRM|nr:MAG: hypothetical protein C7B45_01570 [Sulfobacillus acidophilus]
MDDINQALAMAQKMMGGVYRFSVYQVSYDAIQAFRRATDVSIETRKDGGVVAPSMILCGIPTEYPNNGIRFGSSVLNGGDFFKWQGPIQAGDVIATVTRLIEVRAANGQHGPLLILTYATDYRNQRDDLVGERQHTLIMR